MRKTIGYFFHFFFSIFHFFHFNFPLHFSWPKSFWPTLSLYSSFHFSLKTVKSSVSYLPPPPPPGQGQKLLELKTLVSEPITVTPHEHHNQSQGVITCTLLKGYTNEITEGLSDHGVIDCRCIIRNPKSPQPEPTATLILTFNSATLPDRISIRTGLTERVRPYIPLPRRCFNCHQYGHSGAKCRRAKPVCVRCGLNVDGEHNPDNRQLPLNCIHCHELIVSCPKPALTTYLKRKCWPLRPENTLPSQKLGQEPD